MLNQILEVVAGEVGGSLVKDAGLSQNEAEGAIEVAGEAALEAVSGQIMNGGLDSVMNLFSSKPNSQSADGLSGVIASLLTQKLGDKVGLDSKKIAPVVGMILPVLLKFVSNKNEETPEDDNTSIMDMFGGSGGDGLMGSLGGVLGKFL